VIEQLGAPSETFLTDRMAELDRLGWQAWVAARGLTERPIVPFPPPARTIVMRRRRAVVSRLRSLLGAGGDAPEWIELAVRRARPCVLHAHFGWNGLAAIPSARSHGLPLVVGLHGYDVCVFPRHGFRPDATGGNPARGGAGEVYEELFDVAAAVIVNSRFLEGRLRALGHTRAIEVIPSGIALDEFRYRGPRSDATDLRLLYVGRLVEYKGLDTAICALASLGERIERVRLEVIGDGPRRGLEERRVAELGLQELVTFHGPASRAEVHAALNSADLLVAPARTVESGQAEALGNVLKEALAVGLEVVATDHGGHPEVVPPERRGELIPEGDHEALAEAIERRWAERASWEQRARRGRAWIEERFDWRTLAPRIAAIYRDAVQGRTAS
jgi:colanic acid/amylovoran biosynthesis glycosyltransferase